MAEDRDLAGAHADEVADRADERRLARAVGAEEPEERAVGDLDVEPVERDEAVVVALREPADRERGAVDVTLDVSLPVYARGMRIGELAQRAGVTTRTVRYYESLGLLSSTRREPSGHRHYAEDAVERLAKIDWLKRMGLTLDEIAAVIPLYFGDATAVRGRRKLLRILERHLAETEDRVEGLVAHRDELRSAVERLRERVGVPVGRAS
jgi:MerR family transcriptional regulator, copper efflux regulator